MRLGVHYHGDLVGELLELNRGAWFQYNDDWLARGLEISPLHLSGTSSVLGPWTEAEHYYLAGVFADSLPDNYGRAVLTRRFKEAGLRDPSPLEMLAYLGSRTMGALTYAPSSGDPDSNHRVKLMEAARSARQIVEFDYSDRIDPAIVASGISAGGAQPKILVAMDDSHQRMVTGSDHIPKGMGAWLLKLDVDAKKTVGMAQVEHAYCLMASAAGLDVPETMLIPSKDGATHFAIRRFDRKQDDPNQRVHTHTLSGLMHTGFRRDGWDYDHLLRATRLLTRNTSQVENAFRRLLFNVLAHNRDDHSKNFSFMMDEDGNWSLAPAYDLIFAQSLHGGQAMNINGARIFRAEDIIGLAHQHGISQTRLKTMHGEVADAVGQWSQFAQSDQVNPGRIAAIEASLESVRQDLNLDLKVH